jgi:hypothetical protein
MQRLEVPQLGCPPDVVSFVQKCIRGLQGKFWVIVCLDQILDPSTGMLFFVFNYYTFDLTFIIQGIYRDMTQEEEELLAEGKNYEHSKGAVHTSKLELVFRTMKLVEKAEKDLRLMNPNAKVCCLIIYTCDSFANLYNLDYFSKGFVLPHSAKLS